MTAKDSNWFIFGHDVYDGSLSDGLASWTEIDGSWIPKDQDLLRAYYSIA